MTISEKEAHDAKVAAVTKDVGARAIVCVKRAHEICSELR